MHWWEFDEVNLVAAFLDGRALAAFTCCKSIRSNLRSRDTLRCIKEQYRESERRRGVGDDGFWKECLNVCMRVHFPPFPVRLAKLIRPRAPLPRGHRWLAELRGLEPNSIASVEHIQLAEAMAELSSSIFFGWGSLEVDEGAFPSLRKIASLLVRHKSLSLSIEAHCGLEARQNLPLPGQAREYTRRRADAVRRALMMQASLAGEELEENRFVDPEASGRNRRVELYLRSGTFCVPKRRRRSEIPVEPGKPSLEDRGDEEDSADDEEEVSVPCANPFGQSLVLVQMPDGQQMPIPAAYLQHMSHVFGGFNDSDDSSGEEAAEDEDAGDEEVESTAEAGVVEEW